MITVVADGTCVGQWVDAAPFRAHLRHLMAVGDMSSSMVAVLAGVSPGAAHRLLNGRRGRAMRRISPVTAAKLFQVTPQLTRNARRHPVPAGDTAVRLRRLRTAGWSDGELADAVGLPLSSLLILVGGAEATCSLWTALRVTAEEVALPPGCARASVLGTAA